MFMPPIEDHPLRFALNNELHARPSPLIPVPSTAVFMALMPVDNAAARDRSKDRSHLLALLDRFGAGHPAPEAKHHACTLGRHGVKWENHAEFTTWIAFEKGVSDRPFDPAAFDIFPAQWLSDAPGARITSISFRVDVMPMKDAALDAKALRERLNEWFVAESLAAVTVLGGAAVVASDFRIDPAGHIRMAVFAHPETGLRRVGRIVQRLCEIETYKAISMLGLDCARNVSREMSVLDERLTELVSEMASGEQRADEALDALMVLSAALEKLEAGASFRFGATRAYEAIVLDRVGVLREARFEGRQTLAEFMRRRYDPAMRTVKAAQNRLAVLSERATRAGRMLSTQVEVARSAQNQSLLQSMDRRADLQLRLQHTVEGLSVVAISYYAIGLLSNLALPFATPLGLGKPGVMALLTPLVIGGVWLALRRIRARLH